MYGLDGKCVRRFGREAEAKKKTLESLRTKWVDNIKMDII